MPGRSSGDSGPPNGRKDIGVQVNIELPRKGYTFTAPKWLVWLCAVLMFCGAVFLVTHYVVAHFKPRWMLPSEVVDDMGVDGVILFRQHDRDDNGQLSLEEFEPLAHQLLEVNVSISSRPRPR